MALKFFIVALLVVYSAQGLEAKSVSRSEERGIVDEVQKIIKAALELVKNTIDQVKAVLKTLYESLQEQVQEEIKKALEAILALHEKALEAFEKIIEQAGELAKEAKVCVDAKQGDILDAYNAAQEGSLKCVEASKPVIDAALAKVNDVVIMSVAALRNLLEEFKACANITCKVNVVAKTIAVVPEVKDAVVFAASQASAAIGRELPKFAECSNKVAVTYQQAVEAIRTEIMECVDKINH